MRRGGNAIGVQIRPATQADLDQANQLVAAAFPEAVLDHEDALQRLAEEPGFRPQEAWVAVDGSRVLGHVATLHTTMALEGQWVPALHLGTVCVHPSRQGRGLGSHMLRTVCAQAAGDAELAILTPAHNERLYSFYQRLGYVHVLQQTPRLLIRTGDLPVTPPSARPVRDDDVGALAEVHRATYVAINGSFGRPIDAWRHRVAGHARLWAFHQATFGVAGDPEVRAYAARTVGDVDLEVVEWAAAPGCSDQALAALAAVCHPHPQSQAVVHVGPHHPLRHLLHGAEQEELPPDEEWAMLLVLKPAAMANRVREWVCGRVPPGWGLKVGSGKVEAAGPDGRLMCELGAAVALLYNGASAGRLEAEGALHLHGNVEALLAACFPQRYASPSPLDTI